MTQTAVKHHPRPGYGVAYAVSNMLGVWKLFIEQPMARVHTPNTHTPNTHTHTTYTLAG